MKHGAKIKIAATALALAGMFSGIATASAGTLTGISTKSISSNGNSLLISTQNKTTADKCSDLVLGDVTIYDSILAQTKSQTTTGTYVESNPWTNCSENSSSYLGQYSSIEAYVGQKIRLYVKKTDVATQSYTVDITSWDYH